MNLWKGDDILYKTFPSTCKDEERKPTILYTYTSNILCQFIKYTPKKVALEGTLAPHPHFTVKN